MLLDALTYLIKSGPMSQQPVNAPPPMPDVPQPINEQMFAESQPVHGGGEIQNNFFRPQQGGMFGGGGGEGVGRKPLLSMRAIDTPNPPLNMEQMRSVTSGKFLFLSYYQLSLIP